MFRFKGSGEGTEKHMSEARWPQFTSSLTIWPQRSEFPFLTLVFFISYIEVIVVLLCKLNKILCVTVVGHGGDGDYFCNLPPSYCWPRLFRWRILWKFNFVEQTPGQVAPANPVVIKPHSLTLQALGAQIYTHKLINKDANFNTNLVTGIESWQMAHGPHILC